MDVGPSCVLTAMRFRYLVETLDLNREDVGIVYIGDDIADEVQDNSSHHRLDLVVRLLLSCAAEVHVLLRCV